MKITIYKTGHCYFGTTFPDRNFLYISKVFAFLDLILSRALQGTKYSLKRREPSRYRENFACRAKITVKRLCTYLI